MMYAVFYIKKNKILIFFITFVSVFHVFVIGKISYEDKMRVQTL